MVLSVTICAVNSVIESI